MRLSDVRDALIAAVLAAPDDDAPRLVYADWLLERGEPRGELISLQCRMEGMSDPSEWLVAYELCQKLTEVHAAEWTGLAKAAFRRGFVETISFDPERLPALDALKKISIVSGFPSSPADAFEMRDVEEQYGYDSGKVLEPLFAALPDNIRTLRIFGYEVRSLDLIRAPLERLFIECSLIREPRRLLESEVGCRLIGIGLSHNPLGDKGLKEICDAAGDALRELTIGNAAISGVGLRELANTALAKCTKPDAACFWPPGAQLNPGPCPKDGHNGHGIEPTPNPYLMCHSRFGTSMATLTPQGTIP